MNKFIPGLELNKGFYDDVVKDIMAKDFPNVKYSAALIGYGSDVLGYDTIISTDHMWGPRLTIFVSQEDNDRLARKIEDNFKYKLPLEYMGYPTNYSDPDIEGVSSLLVTDTYPVRHLIWVTDLESFVSVGIGSSWHNKMTNQKWLKATDQGLIEIISGEIYHDGLGTLNTMRESLKFYPDDILKLKLAGLWHYIGNEVAFIGRNRDLGNLSSVKMLSARLVNALMKMCFLIERKYIPYSKWIERGLKDLNCYQQVGPLFESILTQNDPLVIEKQLCEAYTLILKLQNALNITAPIDISTTDYYDRPYKVLFVGQASEVLRSNIIDIELKIMNIDVIAMIETLNGIDTRSVREVIV